jgi:hypothetical protein
MKEVMIKLLHLIEAHAGGPEFADELARAKVNFFSPVGAPGEKGANAEVELSNFIEWFVFNWPVSDAVNIWAKFLRHKGAECSPEELDILKQLNHQNYSLFLVKKIGPEKTAVIDLISQTKYKPVHGLSSGLNVGDLFLGRLITINNKFYLSEGAFFLPRGLSKFYRRRTKAVRKRQVKRDDFLEELRGVAMKSYRYPRMKLEEFYK